MSSDRHNGVPASLTLAVIMHRLGRRVEEPHVVKITSSVLAIRVSIGFGRPERPPRGCPIFIRVVCHPCEPRAIDVDDEDFAVWLIRMRPAYGLS